ncbi:MAG: hypothetical protein KKC99_01865, partial [Proteobacteria bacterium]|nr:hypothetical protein [Pseudomonadota bacterium]
MMRKFTTALLVLLFLLLALPAMAQQDTNAKPPAATVDIQDYRLDNLEKQLGELTARQDAERVELETRLAEKLERETDRTAKWVEEAKDSLTTARTGLSNLLTGFSIIVSLLIAVVGLIGLFIGWRVWKKSDELHKKMDVELNNLEELTKKAAKYVEYIREYKRQLVEERAQSMTSDKTLTFKEREDIQ